MRSVLVRSFALVGSEEVTVVSMQVLPNLARQEPSDGGAGFPVSDD